MAYATPNDLVARYGETELIQLTDRAGAGEVDTAIVDQAIADAEALIDGYLSGRFPVPLSPVPLVLVGYACDLARARLYTDAAPDMVKIRAEEALRHLSMVGQGKLNLGMQPEPTSDNVVLYSGGGRVFNRDAR